MSRVNDSGETGSGLSSDADVGFGLAHKLRTPLATVRSSAQLIERLQMDHEQAAPFLGGIVESVDEMVRGIELFEMFLQIGRENQESACVVDAVRSARRQLSAFIADWQADVSWEGVDSVAVFMPRRFMEMVVKELVENAVLHGGRDLQVSVSLREEAGRRVVLEVADSGRGIPDSVADRVLKPYFSTIAGRPGLGLNRVAKICEELDGHMTWCALEPTGCRFVVVLGGDGDAAVPHRRG